MKATAVFVAALCTLAIAPDRAYSETCNGGGLPGLAEAAARLQVEPDDRSLVTGCNGRGYQIGALLLAALARIERAEKVAADAKTQADALRTSLKRAVQ